MPPPTPTRTRNVYFLGVGVSCALGLPNTPSPIEEVIRFSGEKQWLQTENLPQRLHTVFKYFYPDAVHEGFRPDVVDFFSTLSTYIDVGSGFRGGFTDAPELYRQRKFAIAHMLVDRTRNSEAIRTASNSFLDEVVQPGNIAITSNWDLVVEPSAKATGVPVKLTRGSKTDFVLLKLHGSVDWCTVEDRRYIASEYAALAERLFARRKDRDRVEVRLLSMSGPPERQGGPGVAQRLRRSPTLPPHATKKLRSVDDLAEDGGWVVHASWSADSEITTPESVAPKVDLCGERWLLPLLPGRIPRAMS
ncbi:MAG: hypothetical protein M3285_00960 [Actinomycetota bacterium]|nr:hypothetical protein [Actinomycetota bacterium]MDQ3954105.1 hypothetical protein [Actinomycetota bacterium]